MKEEEEVDRVGAGQVSPKCRPASLPTPGMSVVIICVPIIYPFLIDRYCEPRAVLPKKPLLELGNITALPSLEVNDDHIL